MKLIPDCMDFEPQPCAAFTILQEKAEQQNAEIDVLREALRPFVSFLDHFRSLIGTAPDITLASAGLARLTVADFDRARAALAPRPPEGKGE